MEILIYYILPLWTAKLLRRGTSLWNSLSSILISPLRKILKSKEFSKLIFIPDHFLWGLPFSAIQILGEPLVDKYEIIQIPNASTYYYLNNRAKVAVLSKGPSLIFGNSSGDLKYAEQEAKTVAEILDGNLYLGNECSKQILLSHSSGSPVIHLACHGCFDTDFIERSGILLANGEVMTASEFAKLNLNNSIVILSACESGKLKPLEGNELVGLSANLLEAGASSIIVSLWKVKDRSTMLLIQELYKHWTNGYSLSSSLGRAQKWLKSKYSVYDHPYYWAPFVIIGADPKYKY